MYEIGVLIDSEQEKEKLMAIQHGEQKERISLEEFFALVESDPEHRYEYIDGCPYMMTGGTPDHSIIGANMNRILGEQLRKRPCIVYNSNVYIFPVAEVYEKTTFDNTFRDEE